MKNLFVILTALVAFGCAKKEDEKPAAPPAPAESVSVVQRTSALIADANTLKAPELSIANEGTCFLSGIFNTKIQLLLEDFDAVDLYLTSAARGNLDLINNKMGELSRTCKYVVAPEIEATKNTEYRASLDSMIAALTSLQTLAKQGAVPEIKPQLAQAKSEDINAGKYPVEWLFRTSEVAIYTPKIESKLPTQSSGQSCWNFASMAYKISDLDVTMTSYKVPAVLLGLSSTMKQKAMAMSEHCKGRSVATVQFPQAMPLLKRDLKEIQKIAMDLQSLLQN